MKNLKLIIIIFLSITLIQLGLLFLDYYVMINGYQATKDIVIMTFSDYILKYFYRLLLYPISLTLIMFGAVKKLSKKSK